ncbi:membrane protein YfhO [Xylanibacter ruminicola]|uniref:Membrane protein YfhO n=1 Tax=Xylanibacter ruminicola TaxID=839 RepID=A0A1H5RRW5_XYLRU|nr:YfhO family protein [Xylanibacter ruminicola]SEF40478.1 membrane protein YfhO [Xylanibacter ruminicola]
MTLLKKCLPDVLAVLLFAVLAFAYFFPADIEGRILYRHDASAGRGAGQEGIEYLQKTGERSRWTNALFGGMPTYQMAPSYGSTNLLTKAVNAYHLWLPENVWYVFAYLLGFYILLRAFDFRQHLAALGSIVWAFSTYFLIIIAAGHIWKVWALAYLPPMIAGIVLAYRGKYLWGLLLTAVFTAFEINANHVQMTYYYLFIILFMVIGWLVEAIRQKQMARFVKATATCVLGAAIGLCINLSNLYHTWEYSKESMRGKSELVKQNSANQTNSGLERDYITQWSYGIGETWTLLVPNTKGGASMPLSQSEKAMEHADNDFLPIYQQLGQYWGEQPGTSGPVYVGAFVMMLFILGLFIVKGPMKWALLAATILSILLSWGRNFMGFTDFFLDYVPMYAKFRTVASILVIAEFTIPLLAMLAMKELMDKPELLKPRMKYVGISFLLTGGIAMLFSLMPSMFFDSFISSGEMRAIQSLPAEYIQPLVANLTEMRQAVFTADSLRSFYIILVGMGVLLSFMAGKLKKEYAVGIILVLCLVDLWTVNKRYLNDEMFVPESEREAPQAKSQTDELILRDQSLDYRVLNLASNTFNENETSYYHKSIGGYHAAKLRRYQEMIEQYISPEMQALYGAVSKAGGDMTQVKGDSIYPVLNMLNTKYFIFPLEGGQTVPIQNPYVYGNAWLVDKLDYVNNANEEMEVIGKIDLRHQAVADAKFKEILGEAAEQDTASTVVITSYEPNRLSYEVNSGKGGVLVFSEIYYPGWTATIDGQPAKLGRVNYILRAMNIQPGKHQVELSFFPKTVDRTEAVAYTAYGILILLVVGAVFVEWKKRQDKKQEN